MVVTLPSLPQQNVKVLIEEHVASVVSGVVSMEMVLALTVF